jgi:putative ABC transport system substrate-binding protein
MRRREFIALLGGGAMVWSLAARAQQAAMPVIGFLDVRSPEAIGDRLVAFRQGLKETGFVEGDNVTIAYRWAENRAERLPELAADLVRLKAAVITTAGPPAAFAAKAATTTIPSLFIVADDPVLLGLVTSLGRPRRQSYGHQSLQFGACGKAAGTAARACAAGQACRCAR